MLEPRSHIQDWTLDTEVERHWGYVDRQIPCTSDPGSCSYLDEVYRAHDRGMVYVGVLWLTVVTIFAVWGIAKLSGTKRDSNRGGLARVSRTVSSTIRRYLLADFVRPIFGRTTRLQVLLLGILSAYLAIWTFVGISYKTWITPVADSHDLHNTRTSLGPWSDRIGVMAYALTPLSILLSSRESLLSLITGVPYQHFNFLHRWLGYIILIQSILHTTAWCIVEIRLYQPQPTVAQTWITQLYMIWGVVAMGLLLVLYLLTLPFVIKRTGYEFFRKTHYILAMVYIGACIGHWKKLHCFLTPSLILWGIDRLVRLLRTWLIHRKAIDGKVSLFNPAQAEVSLFPNNIDGDVVRLDLKHPHKPWNVGQHFYLSFTEGSIWQSHPFTPLNLPEMDSEGATKHSYIFRAKGGETKKIANMVSETQKTTTPVILTGPYGGNITQRLSISDNVLCVAGGTGITYVLPVIISLSRAMGSDRKVELIWVVRRRSDIDWIKPELDILEAQDIAIDLKIRVFTTRDAKDDELLSTPSSSETQISFNEEKTGISRQERLVNVRPSTAAATAEHSRHPDVKPIVEGFINKTLTGPTKVFASGPGPMMSELRKVIAYCNSGSKVWKGQERYDVSLECDERLEY